MIYYLKTILIFVWLIVASAVGLVWALLNWGNPKSLRDFGLLFSYGALKIAGIKAEVFGKDKIVQNSPAVLIGNHQSALDVAIFSLIAPPNCTIVIKREVRWIPFVGLMFMAARSILIDRKNRSQAMKEIKKASRRIHDENLCVGFFPEGTRNRSGIGLLPFKKGAFKVAIDAQIPIIPIVASSISPLINHQSKRFKGGTIQIKVLDPISTKGLTGKDTDRLMNDAHKEMIAALNDAAPKGH